MPGLAQLAGFGRGGCIIATIVAIIGVSWRTRHILHVRTVFASAIHAGTDLQWQDDAHE